MRTEGFSNSEFGMRKGGSFEGGSRKAEGGNKRRRKAEIEDLKTNNEYRRGGL